MFNLADYLAERRKLVDAELERQMCGEDVEPSVLHRAMRYSVFPGGKRLRPVLCMAASEAVGGTPQQALLPAVAVELMHSYTLVHDDLPCMDDDPVRRGKPSCHAAFGEANAVLTGDALQALAFEVLAGDPAVDAGLPVAQLVAELASASGSRGVVGGQAEDIASAGAVPDAETVAFVHLHKTADLFRVSMRMGAIAGGADAEELAALAEYGTQFGLAFQICDDLRDSCDVEKSRPAPASYLSIHTPEQARAEALQLLAGASAAVEQLAEAGKEPLRAVAERLAGETVTRDRT
jgi:geranylgeranyl diphosphate synthase type II